MFVVFLSLLFYDYYFMYGFMFAHWDTYPALSEIMPFVGILAGGSDRGQISVSISAMH